MQNETFSFQVCVYAILCVQHGQFPVVHTHQSSPLEMLGGFISPDSLFTFKSVASTYIFMQKNLSSFISIWTEKRAAPKRTRENNSVTPKAFFASHKH